MTDDPAAPRILGLLLGTAIGDALGLPYEGLPEAVTARRSEPTSRYRLLGSRGFVSDDTEQSMLVAQSLLRGGEHDAQCIAAFRRAMVGWFLRLPFGIGGATLRSCLRLTIGVRPSGDASAGNGAMMRASVLGACLPKESERRRNLGHRLAELTHRDPRAIAGALFAAELAALCLAAETPQENRRRLLQQALAALENSDAAEAISAGIAAAELEMPLPQAVQLLGNTGFVLHSLGLCSYLFARFGDEPMTAIEAAIFAGGDTDTHAAIVGGWVGALHGAGALPQDLTSRLQAGPFGGAHIAAMARAIAEGNAPPRFSWVWALLRNLALYPVILGHGFRRIPLLLAGMRRK